MPIQWFPGHMTKTKRLIKENLKKVDIIIEVLDARAPFSSHNPLLDELTASKPHLKVMNKSDLADPKVTTLWVNYFKKRDNNRVIKVSSTKKNNLKEIVKVCQKQFKDARWFVRRPVRAMIVGIPNVGKSTLINSLAANKKANVANTPGLTREINRYDIGRAMQLYDTPGMLWHKFKDEISGFNLATLGSIKDTILYREEIAIRVLPYLIKYYSENIKNRYNLDSIDLKPYQILEEIGKKRGCMVAGGEIDREKSAILFIKEVREGKLGPISMERPADDRVSANVEAVQ